MSEKNTPDSYDIGYGKPPRDTQFKKGVSGNPKGRPKKALDFEHELIKESKSLMTINENGRSKRISKHKAVIKQLMNKAMSGNIPAARPYLDRYQLAFEKRALLEAAQARELERYTDVKNLTDEELNRLVLKNLTEEELETIIAGRKNKEQETKKGHVSNAD